MIETGLRFLAGRTRSERSWLLVLVLVVLPAGVLFGIALPLLERRDESRQQLADLLEQQIWLDQRMAEFRRLGPSAEGASTGGPGLVEVEQSLVEAGLRGAVTRLANLGDGGIDLRMEDVDFGDLAAWLDGLEAGWPLAIRSFRMVRAETPGRVGVDLQLNSGG